MKILLLIDSLGAGGAQRQLVGLAVMLKQSGYDVTVATYHDNSFYADSLSESKVPYVYLKDANNTYKRIWAISRYIRHIKPEWVIAYLETPSIVASIAHIFNRKFKLIVSERNTSQTIGKNEKIRFRLFSFANYIVPNSYAQENFINNHFPKLKDKTITIANFVDTDYFVPIQHRRKQTPKIVIAASIWESKNTLGFIDAVKLLKDKGLKFHISWYGKVEHYIDYFNKCEEKIMHLDVADCISLLDKTKQIRDKYQEADFFVLPSFYEGTPNVICEAMSCGLPVACSNVCDNPIYVQSGENGFLFNPSDINSMAEVIAKLLSIDDETYSKYRDNSRRIAVEKLSKKKFIKSYINLLEKQQ